MLLRVGDVTGVTDGSLDHTTSFLSGGDSELHVLEVVQRVENTEDIETVLDSL